MAGVAAAGRADLTDAQWAVLQPLLPVGARPGCPPEWSRRQLVGGIRRRKIEAAVDQLRDQAAHRQAKGSRDGRLPTIDRQVHKRRHAVECGISLFEQHRAVAADMTNSSSATRPPSTSPPSTSGYATPETT